MNYQEAIDFLYNQLPMYQRDGSSAFKADLNNTIQLCTFLGNPESKFKSVHIAGTNGKGTSAHMIASILQECGYKTGLYTSPHLKSFTERIKINGIEIREEEVVAFVEAIKPAIQKIRPSFFEITVAMAFNYFAEEKVDIAVIEVGLGGRLDSTNVITPEVSLITNIGKDHEYLLGDTLTKIAYEKAGIIKKLVPVVIGKTQSETRLVFEEIASSRKSEIVFADEKYSKSNLIKGVNVCEASFQLSNNILADLTEYQFMNLAGVIGTIEKLCKNGFKISPKCLESGLEKYKENTGLKGRWQVLGTSPRIITDVGHNEDGIKLIIKELTKYDFNKLIIVWGMVTDKDPEKLISLLPSDAYFIFCKPDIPRGMDPVELADKVSHLSLDFEIVYDVNTAISRAKELSQKEDLIFIGGSTFVVAEINDL